MGDSVWSPVTASAQAAPSAPLQAALVAPAVVRLLLCSLLYNALRVETEVAKRPLQAALVRFPGVYCQL